MRRKLHGRALELPEIDPVLDVRLTRTLEIDPVLDVRLSVSSSGAVCRAASRLRSGSYRRLPA
jgi:hypothetical protein